MKKVRPNDKFIHASILNLLIRTVTILWIDFYFICKSIYDRWIQHGLRSMFCRNTLTHFLWPTASKVYLNTLRNDYNVGNKNDSTMGHSEMYLLYLFIIDKNTNSLFNSKWSNSSEYVDVFSYALKNLKYCLFINLPTEKRDFLESEYYR